METVGLIVGALVLLWATASVAWRFVRSVQRWFSRNTGLPSRMRAAGSIRAALGELLDSASASGPVVEVGEGEDAADDDSPSETSDASTEGFHQDDSQ